MTGSRSTAPAAARLRFDGDGLVPAVIQDVADGRVLMVGYMDAEALEATVATGDVHFHSRSRGRLWRKGETSGNVLRLVDIATDCDSDALLVTVEPAGATCHRDTRSCFDPGEEGQRATPREREGFVWLETLWSTVASRAAEPQPGSYTSALIGGGVDAVARKVTEEATEVLLAAKDDACRSTEASRGQVADETADLLYHVLVLLAERNVRPADVIAVLARRHDLPADR